MKNIHKLLIAALALFIFACEGDSRNEGLPDFGTGQGGSMARFTISGNFLYAVDNNKLISFNITNPGETIKESEVELGFDIETIYSFEGYLLVGSQTGMHILSINNPAKPEYISNYTHVTACDPVVAKGNYAYVTLRTGTNCWGVNELHILDISDVEDPTNVNTISMINPHGLGIGNYNLLFVCEGEFGLKVFDITEPVSPELLYHYEGFHAYDVIPHANHLIMTGDNGIMQFEYTADTIFKISEIAVVGKE